MSPRRRARVDGIGSASRSAARTGSPAADNKATQLDRRRPDRRRATTADGLDRRRAGRNRLAWRPPAPRRARHGDAVARRLERDRRRRQHRRQLDRRRCRSAAATARPTRSATSSRTRPDVAPTHGRRDTTIAPDTNVGGTGNGPATRRPARSGSLRSASRTPPISSIGVGADRPDARSAACGGRRHRAGGGGGTRRRRRPGGGGSAPAAAAATSPAAAVPARLEPVPARPAARPAPALRRHRGLGLRRRAAPAGRGGTAPHRRRRLGAAGRTAAAGDAASRAIPVLSANLPFTGLQLWIVLLAALGLARDRIDDSAGRAHR